MGSSEKLRAQSVYVWYGNLDGSPISGNVDDTVKIDVYIQTDPDVYVAGILLCLGANEQYIDTMLSSVMDDSLIIFYPFSEWDIAAFVPTSYSPPNEPGWFCQPFLGIARLGAGNEPWLHNEIPLKVLTFVAKSVNDSTLMGSTVEAFGPGQDQVQGSSKASDTLAQPLTVIENFSYLSFGGLGAVAGIVSDSVGQPIENVIVEIADTTISDTTDNQGYYILSHLIPGTYNLIFSHPDYIDTSISDVSITADDTTIQNVVLYTWNNGYISGNIIDVVENGIEGVEITVLNAGISDTSDSNGDYFLVNIPAGIYSISFSHPDYKDTIINGVQVAAEDTTSLDIVLFLINSGFIAGSVIDSTGISLEGVEVAVVNTIIVDTTGFNGNYLLMNVPVGPQSISFKHPAYRDTIITGITVSLNDTAFVDTLVFFEGADGPLPDKLGLLTNYPNPFTASTTIRFYLAAPDLIEVEIFDLLGRKVKSFAAIHGETGFNLVQWFASDYAAGIYIVKVNSSNASITKPIIKF